MKALKYLNLYAIGTPILLGIIGLIDNDFFFWALLSTIMTGIIHIIIGIKMLMDEPKNNHIRLYAIIVFLFFLAWYINSINGYNDIISYILIGFPPILAIYLSIIIYKKQTL